MHPQPPPPTPASPRLSAWGKGEEGLSLKPNFKKAGLTAPQLLEGVAGKEGLIFFQEEGGVQLSHNKLQSEIKIYFFVIT